MRGLFLEDAKLTYREDLPEPEPGPDDALVEVIQAGICATDLALSRGYMRFAGVPGHEFVGVARTGPFAGKRVVGDINAACGACDTCRANDPHHCPNRTVLGILGHSGAFAERLCLPTCNLLEVVDGVSSDAATFVEPLAAAFEIARQVDFEPGERALVAGDGKLGLLCAWALHLDGMKVTVAGRHTERAALLPDAVELRLGMLEADARSVARFDVVVEATGRADVLPRVLSLVRPRGTLVLKTTTEAPTTIDLSALVVDEITLIGSRCGPFDRALEVLTDGLVPVEKLIDARYPLHEGGDAFARASAGGALKILLENRTDN
jgi:threonine dehydrogenase-like Zn-dependent dehydrogenase